MAPVYPPFDSLVPNEPFHPEGTEAEKITYMTAYIQDLKTDVDHMVAYYTEKEAELPLLAQCVG
jgi:hypothetical protein